MKRKRRRRSGWPAVAVFSALIIALGICLAVGMDALLPSYDGKIMPLSPELLSPAKVNEVTEESLTIYPWNLYDPAKAVSLSAEEAAAFAVCEKQLAAALQICRAEYAVVPKAPPAAADKITGGENGSLYFVKDRSVGESGGLSYQVDAAFNEAFELIYFHYRRESVIRADEDEALSFASAAIRSFLQEEALLYQSSAYQQLMDLLTLRKTNDKTVFPFDFADFRRADVLSVDGEVLVVCTSSTKDSQLILFIDPYTQYLTGVSLQQ